VFGTTTEVLLVIQLVVALLVMSCVEPSLKTPTAWNEIVTPAVGTAVTIGLGHVVSIGAGVVLAVEVETGVGVAGVPGQIEMLCKKGPPGDGMPHGVTGIPPVKVAQGVLELLLPQLHDKVTASSIIAAPRRIHRALFIIGIQL
jgi:hypothetical protein